jgi:hypothetical protein
LPVSVSDHTLVIDDRTVRLLRTTTSTGGLFIFFQLALDASLRSFLQSLSATCLALSAVFVLEFLNRRSNKP